MTKSKLRALCFRSGALLVVAALTRMGGAATSTPLEPMPGGVLMQTATTAALRATDLAGVSHLLQDDPKLRASALVFISTQCPISNKYVPELNRLTQAAPGGTQFFGVISDPTVTRAAAVAFVKEYQIAFPVLFDASGELAQRLAPTMTPESFVLDRGGVVQYRGRIDDTWADLKKQRVSAMHHDLQDALTAVAAGKPVATPKTDTVGCYFEAWKEGALPSKVTYTRDIAPILNANCVTCHRAGEVAPFSLTSYEEAAKHAKQMAKVTSRHIMPPWKAEPGYGHFADERRLSDHEIAVLGAWSAAGAPQGDLAELPPPPQFKDGWKLGEPDMVVTMPKPFEVPASGRDTYRAFVIPLNLPADQYAVAFEFNPGATTVLHHALFFLDDNGAARKLEAASTDGLPGYRTGGGGPGFRPSGGMGGWAPGATPYFLPDGVGRPVHKGADLVFQVHYHPDGKPHTDLSKLAIYFAKKPVVKQLISWPLMNNQIDIPAGEWHYVRTAQIVVPADITLSGVTPHMHLVGKEMKVVATRPDGVAVPLIWVKDWDFRWQDQYQYVDPVKLPKGTVVRLEAAYDNSEANTDNPNSPPKRVRRGEQTTDEMCICFINLTVDAQNGIGLAPARPGAARGGILQRLFGRGDTGAGATGAAK